VKELMRKLVVFDKDKFCWSFVLHFCTLLIFFILFFEFCGFQKNKNKKAQNFSQPLMIIIRHHKQPLLPLENEKKKHHHFPPS